MANWGSTFMLILANCILCTSYGRIYYRAPTYNQRKTNSRRSMVYNSPFTQNIDLSSIFSSQQNIQCPNVSGPNDIRRLLPGRFMSEQELLSMIPSSFTNAPQPNSYTAVRKIIVSRFTESGFSKPGTSPYINDGICGCCVTELSYEIVKQITDFDGNNHTIINFNNAFQFIPSGRCSNENAPCAGGTARCKQVHRAHWSLVWTPGVGARLVAHEVPSHCQCINLGAAASASPSFG